MSGPAQHLGNYLYITLEHQRMPDLPGDSVNRHNLPLARHTATDMTTIGWGNYCKQFKQSRKPGWLASIVEGDSIINTTYNLLTTAM